MWGSPQLRLPRRGTCPPEQVFNSWGVASAGSVYGEGTFGEGPFGGDAPSADLTPVSEALAAAVEAAWLPLSRTYQTEE